MSDSKISIGMKAPGTWFQRVVILAGFLVSVTDGHAIGFLVLKAPNGKPEFADVVPFVRIQSYAANVVITTYDKIERPVSRTRIITYLEIDETPLRGNLVTDQDFAQVKGILSQLESLAEEHPKMNKIGGAFISAVKQILAAHDEGRVKYWGQWMSKSEYVAKLEAEKELALAKKAEMAEAEAARMAAAEAVRMAEAQALEKKMREVAMKAEQNRIEAEAREREQRRVALNSNLASLAEEYGELFSARWDRLLVGAPDADTGGSPLPVSMIDELNEEFFPSDPVQLPHRGPIGVEAIARESFDRSRCLVLFSDGSTGDALAVLLCATLEYDNLGMPIGSEDTRTWGQIAGIFGEMGTERLARAISTLLVKRQTVGGVTAPLSLSLDAVSGWLDLGEPGRSPDGRMLGSMTLGLGAIESE
jgi:hypothetical protein